MTLFLIRQTQLSVLRCLGAGSMKQREAPANPLCAPRSLRPFVGVVSVWKSYSRKTGCGVSHAFARVSPCARSCHHRPLSRPQFFGFLPSFSAVPTRSQLCPRSLKGNKSPELVFFLISHPTSDHLLPRLSSSNRTSVPALIIDHMLICGLL